MIFPAAHPAIRPTTSHQIRFEIICASSEDREETISQTEVCQAGLSSEASRALQFVCLNRCMFARKIRVEYEDNGHRLPCPLKWLDSFSMRNFTNASIFDDTLPTADGQMEIGTSVPIDQLKEAMEDWFRRKGYLPKDSQLILATN